MLTYEEETLKDIESRLAKSMVFLRKAFVAKGKLLAAKDAVRTADENLRLSNIFALNALTDVNGLFTNSNSAERKLVNPTPHQATHSLQAINQRLNTLNKVIDKAEGYKRSLSEFKEKMVDARRVLWNLNENAQAAIDDVDTLFADASVELGDYDGNNENGHAATYRPSGQEKVVVPSPRASTVELYRNELINTDQSSVNLIDGRRQRLDGRVLEHTRKKQKRTTQKSFERSKHGKQLRASYQKKGMRKCQYCKSKFPNKTSLYAHLFGSHPKQKIFECYLCGYFITCSSNLKIHMSMHTGERTFKCLGCGKTFSHKGNLNQHLQRKAHQNCRNAMEG